MKSTIEIKNYRCFNRNDPLRIELNSGMTGFVGPNNVGKTSILKFFVELRGLFSILTMNPDLANTLRHGTKLNTLHTFDPDEIFSNENEGDIEINFNIGDTSKAQYGRENIPLANIVKIIIERNTKKIFLTIQCSGHPEIPYNAGVDNVIDGFLYISGKRADLQIVQQYFKILAKTTYIGPFRNAINSGSKDDYFDISVGDAFIKNWRVLKTGNNKSDQRAVNLLEKELTRIFEFSKLSIDASDDTKSLQLNINDETYKSHEIGSGLSQFILVFANALIQKPEIILIDEPELGLHPTLQRTFLTTLASFANTGLVFTTHSMGLARTTSDKLYSVTKDVTGKRNVKLFEATHNLVELLGEMSFSGFREVGFDKILLVEGVSEIKTIQQFLKYYDTDHRVILLPLGGAAMLNGNVELELSELMRLSNNQKVFSIIDSERTTAGENLSKDREEYVNLCNKLGILHHTLERRATENYLTEDAIKTVKGSNYRKLGDYEKLSEAELPWSKRENWLIASKMSSSDIDSTDLGKFLKKVVKSKV